MTIFLKGPNSTTKVCYIDPNKKLIEVISQELNIPQNTLQDFRITWGSKELNPNQSAI